MRNTTTRPDVWLVLILALAWTPGARAQKIEISPFATLPFGGEFESDRGDRLRDFDVDDGSGYGLSLGVALTRDLQLELFWSHQESDLVEERFFALDFPLTELEIDYYHVGVAYHWGGGQLRPFVAGSLGITAFSPADPLQGSETRFSLGAGGGVKIFLTQSFALRFEARAFTTVIDEGDEFCRRGRCYYDEGTYFLQGELRGGLVFAF